MDNVKKYIFALANQYCPNLEIRGDMRVIHDLGIDEIDTHDFIGDIEKHFNVGLIKHLEIPRETLNPSFFGKAFGHGLISVSRDPTIDEICDIVSDELQKETD